MSHSDHVINEFQFDQLLNSPHQYGIRSYNDNCVAFKKVGNKLTANSEDMEKIKTMVSKEYFDKNFIPLEYGK
jgi:hypothetical protein